MMYGKKNIKILKIYSTTAICLFAALEQRKTTKNDVFCILSYYRM